MKNLFLLLTVLISSTAYAQTPVQVEGFANRETQVYSATATATTSSSTFYFPTNSRALLLELIAVYNSGTTTTLDVKLQHSSDGSTWFDVPDAAFTQVGTSSANYEMHINRQIIKLRSRGRVVLTLAGTSPNYDVDVTLYADAK